MGHNADTGLIDDWLAHHQPRRFERGGSATNWSPAEAEDRFLTTFNLITSEGLELIKAEEKAE